MPPDTRIREKALKIGKATSGAGARSHDALVDTEIAAKLMLHGPAKAADLTAPLRAFDQLLGAERDQHAEDNDADFTRERAPAV
jgi:hypothetical protein